MNEVKGKWRKVKVRSNAMLALRYSQKLTAKNKIKMSYKSFVTLERIERNQVPHERIRAVAGITSSRPGNKFYKQHLAYLSDAGTDNLNKIRYDFDLEKYYGKPLAQITDTEKQQALTYIKGKFKRMYSNNAENMFNNLGRQKIEHLFLINGVAEIRDANHFKVLLNNNSTFKNNALKFIKAE